MKPLILITNDDGVLSPGLHAAAEAVCDLADLLIVAPHAQQTSMGRAYPKSPDMGIIDEHEIMLRGKPYRAFGVHGSPATAVSHAVLELAERKIDFCISGINYGENIGLTLVSSGTVGAALEANSYDIPSIAVSMEVIVEEQHSSEYGNQNWEVAKHFTRQITKKILEKGLPEGIALLNINIPKDATIQTKIEMTRQSRENYYIYLKPPKRDFSLPHKLKVDLFVDEKKLQKGTDVFAFLKNRTISVTPLTWDMTSQDKYNI